MKNTENTATGATGGDGQAVPFAERICENCAAWMPYAEGIISGVTKGSGGFTRSPAGECRRKEPRHVDDGRPLTGRWPVVEPDDWCLAWVDGGAA